MSASLEIQWIHSIIGCPEDQRATIRGLGLRRLHEKRIISDTPQIRGMLSKVSHLVTILGKGSLTHKPKRTKKASV